MSDLFSAASEISGVVADFLLDSELWEGLQEHQKANLLEIANSTTATFEDIISLWNASCLTY